MRFDCPKSLFKFLFLERSIWAFVGDICEAEEHWDQKGDEGSRLDTERKEVSPDGESECFEFDFVF